MAFMVRGEREIRILEIHSNPYFTGFFRLAVKALAPLIFSTLENSCELGKA